MKVTWIERSFAGEVRRFVLLLRGQEAVEDKCEAGLGEVLGHLWTGMSDNPAGYRFRTVDIRETIFQALVDGGLKDAEASRLMRLNFDGKPAIEFVPLATEILTSWLYGLPEGKARAAGNPDETTPETVASTSPRSTGPRQP